MILKKQNRFSLDLVFLRNIPCPSADIHTHIFPKIISVMVKHKYSFKVISLVGNLPQFTINAESMTGDTMDKADLHKSI